MPNRQNMQHGTAADSGAVYSPRLCNEDLAPTRDQNWSWYNIFSFWMSDVHSMGIRGRRELLYARAGKLAGVALPAGGNLHCAVVCQPGGETEPDGGRAVCGDQPSGLWRVRGKHSGGDPRAYRLCRYGIQTYLAANALMLVALKFWPSLSSLTTGALGLSHWAGSALPLCGYCRQWSSGTA